MKKERDQINAFLGKETEFEGKLSFTGVVRVDGRFKGEISSEGTLIIGETAVVASEIRAAHVIVSGEVRGTIVAADRIEIHAPARVYGNISAPVVVIDEGVIFEGNCEMEERGKGLDKKVALFPQ